MARPRKTGLDYFPFDTDFFSDEKIVCIAGEFGVKGEMVAIRLLCEIYRSNGYFIKWDDALLYKLSKDITGASADLVRNVVRSLARWGFFNKDLLDSESILTSLAIQRRYFDAVKLRKIDEQSLVRKYLLHPKVINSLEMGINSMETKVNSRINALNKIKLKKDNNKLLSKKEENPDENTTDLIKVIFGDQGLSTWIESNFRKLKIDEDVFRRMVEQFVEEAACRSWNIDRERWLTNRSLFFTWASNRLKQEKDETQRKDRFQQRRDPGPSTWTTEDFKESF